jgi:hypothetical protein
MIEELVEQVWSHKGLHEQAGFLLQNHLKRTLLGQDVELGSLEWLTRLAKSAAILSTSSDTNKRLLAYKVASALAEHNKERFSGLKYILLIVLSRLGNFPGASFAKERLEICEDRLPIHIFGETEYRKERNTVTVNGQPLLLTDFQVGLWQAFDRFQDVSVSAPTSAGKSFVIQQFIRRAVLDGTISKCVFIVPSRALITQVTDDVSGWLGESELEFEIISIPLTPEAKVPLRAIFVMTQERLQLALFNHKELHFEIAVVDESHGLGDGPRGILLTNVIDEIRARKPGTKLLFAGPNISNPKELGTAFGIEAADVSTRDQTVAQNIIFVDVDATSNKKLKLACLTEGVRVPLGTLEAPIDLRTEREKLVFIPLVLGGGGQSLVYVLGPAQCEDVAFGLADALQADASPYLMELSSFVADAVHPKFQLVNSVKSGVGFHYGRVPSLVRKEIEEAFSRGHLRYLVTTSTLLQGVNLPARNLFMLKPHRGDDHPISSIDFWNLAGRAGRLGKEFEGNVFLIDYDSWETKPLEGEKEAKVSNSFDVHVRERTSELLAYIGDPNVTPTRDQTDEFENTFVKLYTEFRRGNLHERLRRFGVAPEVEEQISDALGRVSKTISVPDEIFDACPTVSPYRQESLLRRIRASIERRGAEYVIPRHPLASGAWPSLTAMFKRCQDEILRYPAKDKSYVFVTYLALRWMKGDPLPKIIEDSIRYKTKQGGSANIPTVIRQTLIDIEHRLRFEYVRLTTCYNALLKIALDESGNAELIPSIPAIPVYLEVGACTPTMMSFMELGISRYTAAKLHIRPARSDLSAQGARDWLSRQDVDALNIPRASASEIRRLGLSG